MIDRLDYIFGDGLQLWTAVYAQVLPAGPTVVSLGATTQPGSHHTGLCLNPAIRTGDLVGTGTDGKVKCLRILSHVELPDVDCFKIKRRLRQAKRN